MEPYLFTMRGCVSCLQGFHSECNFPNECCCNESSPESLLSVVQAPGLTTELDIPSGGFTTAEEYYATTGLKDPHSTGRKRAKELYPLDYDAPCEWRYLKFAGGGESPIVGCTSGKQQSRHHGPNKSTVCNEEGNVHRICHDCHNVYHGINDPGYIWGDHIRRNPHDSESLASDVELAQEAIRRSKGIKNVSRNQGD